MSLYPAFPSSIHHKNQLHNRVVTRLWKHGLQSVTESLDPSLIFLLCKMITTVPTCEILHKLHIIEFQKVHKNRLNNKCV